MDSNENYLSSHDTLLSKDASSAPSHETERPFDYCEEICSIMLSPIGISFPSIDKYKNARSENVLDMLYLKLSRVKPLNVQLLPDYPWEVIPGSNGTTKLLARPGDRWYIFVPHIEPRYKNMKELTLFHMISTISTSLKYLRNSVEFLYEACYIILSLRKQILNSTIANEFSEPMWVTEIICFYNRVRKTKNAILYYKVLLEKLLHRFKCETYQSILSSTLGLIECISSVKQIIGKLETFYYIIDPFDEMEKHLDITAIYIQNICYYQHVMFVTFNKSL